MASFVKRSGSWYATVRRKGYPSISKTFPNKALAKSGHGGRTEYGCIEIFRCPNFIRHPTQGSHYPLHRRRRWPRWFRQKQKRDAGQAEIYLGRVVIGNLTLNRIMEFVQDRIRLGAVESYSMSKSWIASIFQSPLT